jgi:heme-degrading monooxygenase HmoA
MIKLVEMDERVTLRSQMEHDAAPVTLVNTFSVAAEDADRFVEVWGRDAAFFKRQPGFISAQLHRGTAGSCVFLNYAVWASVDHFRRAFAQPEFRAGLQQYPASTIASPHLFAKVAVPGICAD